MYKLFVHWMSMEFHRVYRIQWIPVAGGGGHSKVLKVIAKQKFGIPTSFVISKPENLQIEYHILEIPISCKIATVQSLTTKYIPVDIEEEQVCNFFWFCDVLD